MAFSWIFHGFFVAPVLGKIYAYSPWNISLTEIFSWSSARMSVPKCLIFQDLEGLTKVFGRMSAGMSGAELPLWAGYFVPESCPPAPMNRCSRVAKRSWLSPQATACACMGSSCLELAGNSRARPSGFTLLVMASAESSGWAGAAGPKRGGAERTEKQNLARKAPWKPSSEAHLRAVSVVVT